MRMRVLLVAISLIGVGCRAETPSARPAPVPTTTVAPSAAAPSAPQPIPTPTFGHAKVLIDTEEGSAILDVEAAETDEQHQFGYMFREEIASDEGMVFLWGEEHSGGFWMKNVKVPLSVAFFDEEGIIVSILDMEPCAKDPCEIYTPLHEGSATTYFGALEVKQGVFEELGVQEGDRVTVTR